MKRLAGAGASLGTINSDLAPVPEPGSMALMALGGTCLLLWRRRQTKASAV